MSTLLLFDITVFVLALLVGFAVISKVPATLHTPLMSAANAIHGVVFIGALIITAMATTTLEYVIAFFAMALAAMNVVGGYAVTDRMLEMFKPKPAAATTQPAAATTQPAAATTQPAAATTQPAPAKAADAADETGGQA